MRALLNSLFVFQFHWKNFTRLVPPLRGTKAKHIQLWNGVIEIAFPIEVSGILNWEIPRSLVKQQIICEAQRGFFLLKPSLSWNSVSVFNCQFIRKAKLALDDIYMNLIEKIQALTRSYLYRCLKRAQKKREWSELLGLHSFCREAFSILKYINSVW